MTSRQEWCLEAADAIADDLTAYGFDITSAIRMMIASRLMKLIQAGDLKGAGHGSR